MSGSAGNAGPTFAVVVREESAWPAAFGKPDGRMRLTEGWLLWRAGSCAAAGSPSGRQMALLSGEVLQPRWGGSAASLAEAFESCGAGCLRGLDGFFFALVAEEGGEVLWATDRLGSRRFFWRAWEGGVALSDRPDALAALGAAVDPVGLAWALASPAIYGGRSLWEGVRSVPPGAEGRATADGLRVDAQWRPALSALGASKAAGGLMEGAKVRLAEAIRESVRACLDDRETLIALSGGWDATTIAAEVVAMGRRARALSYGVPPFPADSDAMVAQRQAASLGLPHEIVESYAGPLDRWLALNVGRLACQREPIVEADAWLAVAEEHEGVAVLLGDEWFGMRSETVPKDDDEVLNRLQMFGLDRCPALSDPPSEPWMRLGEALEEQRRAIVAEARERCGDLLGLRELLFLEQRLRCFHMPMRRWFPGDALALRNPFLTRRMLDVVQALPLELRLGKRLFRETVAGRYPELFRIPRALAQANELDLAAEIRAAAPAIVEGLQKDSPLDPWVPPERIAALLQRVAAQGAPPGWSERLKAMVPRRLRIRHGTARAAREGPRVPESLLLVRLLAVRTALARR